jgi:CheY-like chemotaxis protein
MPKTSARPRVLVIDDEPLLGQTIRLGLGDMLDVTCEVSGEAGLSRVLAGEDYEVVLCDLSLPDRHGSEIYRELSRSRPGLVRRFVVMTGGAVSDQARDFLEGHQGRVLAKPFTLKDVQEMVDEVIGSSARESA